MSGSCAPDSPSRPLDRDGLREAWRAALCALARAPDREGRRLLLQHRDFSNWPLDESAVLHSLTAWLQQPGRRLWLLVAEPDKAARAHPRLVRWRSDWAHRVQVLTLPEETLGAEADTSLRDGAQLLSDHLWLEQADVSIGRLRVHPQTAPGWSRFDAISQRLLPAWPLRSLGL